MQALSTQVPNRIRADIGAHSLEAHVDMICMDMIGWIVQAGIFVADTGVDYSAQLPSSRWNQ